MLISTEWPMSWHHFNGTVACISALPKLRRVAVFFQFKPLIPLGSACFKDNERRPKAFRLAADVPAVYGVLESELITATR